MSWILILAASVTSFKILVGGIPTERKETDFWELNELIHEKNSAQDLALYKYSINVTYFYFFFALLIWGSSRIFRE